MRVKYTIHLYKIYAKYEFKITENDKPDKNIDQR